MLSRRETVSVVVVVVVKQADTQQRTVFSISPSHHAPSPGCTQLRRRYTQGRRTLRSMHLGDPLAFIYLFIFFATDAPCPPTARLHGRNCNENRFQLVLLVVDQSKTFRRGRSFSYIYSVLCTSCKGYFTKVKELTRKFQPSRIQVPAPFGPGSDGSSTGRLAYFGMYTM